MNVVIGELDVKKNVMIDYFFLVSFIGSTYLCGTSSGGEYPSGYEVSSNKTE